MVSWVVQDFVHPQHDSHSQKKCPHPYMTLTVKKVPYSQTVALANNVRPFQHVAL